MRQEIARTRTVPQCHPFNSLYFEETKICRLRPYRNLGWSALLWAIRALFCLSCWFVSTSVTPIESFVACVQLLLLLLLPSWQCACLPDTTSAQGSTRPDLLQHYFSMSFFFLYHVRPLTPPVCYSPFMSQPGFPFQRVTRTRVAYHSAPWKRIGGTTIRELPMGAQKPLKGCAIKQAYLLRSIPLDQG